MRNPFISLSPHVLELVASFFSISWTNRIQQTSRQRESVMNIRELLETQAEKYGQKTFLCFEEEQISYRAFNLDANRDVLVKSRFICHCESA